MPDDAEQRDEIVEEAAELARDVAPDLDCILLTHYADADTLDTIRPGETDLGTVQAVTRTVAAEMASFGVEVLVQRADRAAYRRWLRAREDGAAAGARAAAGRAWVDRGRLLRGAAALEVLGLDPDALLPPHPRFPAAPGPTADRLLDTLAEEEGAGFDGLVGELLAAGRQDVLDLALRKVEAREGEAAAEELLDSLLAAAEGAPLGPAGWAELVALPVALSSGTTPDALALAAELLASGAVPETLEVRFLPGWRSPDAVAALSPVALRRVLVDLLAGAEPRDLPPGDTDELAERGFAVLIGLQIDWDILTWEEIEALGGLPEPPSEAEETTEEARRTTLFDRWRAASFETHDGCVPLALVAPSELAAEMDAFLEEAADGTEALDEIREAVATARREAGSDEVVCRAEVIGDGLELSFYTVRGRFLDSLSLEAGELPARAEEMPRLLEAFVRVVRDAPGR
jgi:hypothetical protein